MTPGRTLEEVTHAARRARILEALEKNHWHITNAALDLGTHVTYLHRLIRQYGLRAAQPLHRCDLAACGENQATRRARTKTWPPA